MCGRYGFTSEIEDVKTRFDIENWLDQIYEKEEQYPYLFKCKDQELFGFAGLYFIEKDAEGHEQNYYAIITTDANEIMLPIHHRMPVILDKDDEDEWLNTDNVEPEQLLKLLK